MIVSDSFREKLIEGRIILSKNFNEDDFESLKRVSLGAPSTSKISFVTVR
jgi:hypothetical protein